MKKAILHISVVGAQMSFGKRQKSSDFPAI